MKIAVLTSGGVDSSVALRLLHRQGHDLTAFYLKIWLEDELSFLGDCPWKEDLKYLKKICKELKIPLKIVPLQKEYFDTVVKYTIREVKAGRTPNPDIMCNNAVKFGLFVKKIGPSFEKISTGHYAQVIQKKGRYYLKRCPDKIKDQTYFLANLKQDQLKRIIFPIGHLTKAEVRSLAKKFKLPNKDRKDSQGICFLGRLRYRDFIRHYLGERKGDLVEFETGKILGHHKGFFYYTIGQRKDIELSNGPWYVVKKDIKKNIVYISRHYHEKDKPRDTFKVGKFNWFSGKFPIKKTLHVKTRHGPHLYKCTLKKSGTVRLNKSDQGLAAGQFAVFYDGKTCIGSGVIL
ncbi:MAG: tRNA 2-thiouridine(34) synthase MnmA [Candidatus Gracilibacteria bacterium]